MPLPYSPPRRSGKGRGWGRYHPSFREAQRREILYCHTVSTYPTKPIKFYPTHDLPPFSSQEKGTGDEFPTRAGHQWTTVKLLTPKMPLFVRHDTFRAIRHSGKRNDEKPDTPLAVSQSPETDWREFPVSSDHPDESGGYLLLPIHYSPPRKSGRGWGWVKAGINPLTCQYPQKKTRATWRALMNTLWTGAL